ncbi:MAG: hypothetical protein JJU29_10320 [Verrucomicrobia bacterium]|nr:hypothetical protein [Verrucomicrobiota bacterium]MCH8513442.1 hypothetical protein [Kiritimatiellia bacterium]
MSRDVDFGDQMRRISGCVESRAVDSPSAENILKETRDCREHNDRGASNTTGQVGAFMDSPGKNCNFSPESSRQSWCCRQQSSFVERITPAQQSVAIGSPEQFSFSSWTRSKHIPSAKGKIVIMKIMMNPRIKRGRQTEVIFISYEQNSGNQAVFVKSL